MSETQTQIQVTLTVEQVKILKDFLYNEGWRGDRSGALSDIYKRLFWAELKS